MRHILLLTDFSENALLAAKQVALCTEAWKTQKVIVYHTYNSVTVVDNEPIVVVNEEVKAAKEKELADWFDQIRLLFPPQVALSYQMEDVDLPMGVQEICRAQAIDLVALGITGQTGFAKILVGSNAITLMDICPKPMLIVSHKVDPAVPKNVLATTDLKEVDRKLDLFNLDQVLETFQAKLYVLNVAKREASAADLAQELKHLHERLDKYHPIYDYISHDDVAMGIEEYAKEKHIDLILSFHKKQGLLSSLFKSSISKKIAWNGSANLLVIPMDRS
ncbi:nucleotide-binding universal stress UspA family protein [Sphingobacterium zeae]|uniref:Nucleotide-binding universal stress UspA family protein n=1 Tax=Sphingobacterium zeae TaxID=1776859 RepID=A0ABU0TZR9_9SPHI|nr:universal stress protein [Sphingobacterium zeae]MDQ1148208.1 nucleotide-binding universal stress UspA family protein [Sphingobacterium zeae]